MSCETAFLSQLVPYDLGDKRNGDLKKGLYEFQALLRASLEAFLAWQNGQLEKFDSLVGENACEIRAIWLTHLPKVQKSNLSCQIESSISKIDDLLANNTIACLMRSGESLESLLKRKGLDIALLSEEMFMIQSYLLSEMKIVKTSKNHIASIYRVEVAEPKNLLRFGNISVSYARNLLSRLRRHLAILSVQIWVMGCNYNVSIANEFLNKALVRARRSTISMLKQDNRKFSFCGSSISRLVNL